jgi:hypothetical protein
MGDLDRRHSLVLLGAAWLGAQDKPNPAEPAEKPVEFLCPMDPDVRQFKPGTCPRCGMKLLPGLPDPIEYPVTLRMAPRAPKPGQPVKLRFSILHPKTKKPVPELELMHERVFHLFLISEDLEHFAHEHPRQVGPGEFELEWKFPQGGFWRALCDFFPRGATPQLIPKSILLAPSPAVAPIPAPLNMQVSLRTEPAQPLAGEKTLLFYRVTPREDFEPFLGAMGHLLVSSADRIDMIHTHPFLVDGGLAEPPKDHKQIQFNVIFPRPGRYRLWVQFQRAGQVNTIPQDVEVRTL